MARQKVFAFETAEQAWSYIAVASTAGYTAYDRIKPRMTESLGKKIYVDIPSEYSKFMPELTKLCRTSKCSEQAIVNEHAFNFDKFMDDPRLLEESRQIRSEIPNDDVHPMRLRARLHQELPQNRIRMTTNG